VVGSIVGACSEMVACFVTIRILKSMVALDKQKKDVLCTLERDVAQPCNRRTRGVAETKGIA